MENTNYIIEELKMIEELHEGEGDLWTTERLPNNYELMNKINEIIKWINNKEQEYSMEDFEELIKRCVEELIKEYKKGKPLRTEQYECIIDYLLLMRGEQYGNMCK